MKKRLHDAILAHSRWKYRLNEAISSGKSPHSVRETRVCDFFEWLSSPESEEFPGKKELLELDRLFHKEVSEILEFAIQGKKEEAGKRMQSGSDFKKISTDLTNQLAELKAQLGD